MEECGCAQQHTLHLSTKVDILPCLLYLLLVFTLKKVNFHFYEPFESHYRHHDVLFLNIHSMDLPLPKLAEIL